MKKAEPLWWNIFIAEYLQNGQKAAPAYRKCFPKIKTRSAETLGGRLLRNVAFCKVLEKATKKAKEEIGVTFDAWMKELRSIGEKKNLQPSAMAKLRALEMIGKSLGYLKDKVDVEHTGVIEVIDPYAKQENDRRS